MTSHADAVPVPPEYRTDRSAGSAEGQPRVARGLTLFLATGADWRISEAGPLARELFGALLDRAPHPKLWELLPEWQESPGAERLEGVLHGTPLLMFEHAFAGRSQPHRIIAMARANGIGFHVDEHAPLTLPPPLLEGEVLLRQIEDVAGIGAWRIDCLTGATSASEGFFALTGLSREQDFCFIDMLERTHVEDRRPLAEAYRAFQRGDAPLDIEHRLTRSDGEVLHLHTLGRHERDAAGTLVALAGTTQDVSARKEAEKDRRSQKLRALNRFSLLASSKLGDADLLQVLVEEVRETIGAHLGSVHLLPTANDGQPTTAAVSLSDKYAKWRDFDAPVYGLGLLAEATSGQRILRLTHQELIEHPAWMEFGQHQHSHVPLRGLLSVPLRDRHGQCLGFLQISDRYAGEFNADDEAFAIQFAQIISIALGWGRIIEELQDAKERLGEQIDELAHNREMLAEAERIAKLGSWEIDLSETGKNRAWRWSDEMFRLLGLDPAIDTADIDTVRDAVHPDDRPMLMALFDAAILSGAPYETGFRVRHSDGSLHWLHSIGRVIRDGHGRAQRLVGASQDITERRRHQEVERDRAEILRGVATGVPLTETLASITTLYERHHPPARCSIMLIEKGRYLRVAAGGSLPENYNRAIDGLEIGPNVGSCGTAAWRKERVISVDIAADSLWEPFRPLAAEAGLGSCWSTPILDIVGDVLGTFAVYYRSPHQPMQNEIETIDVFASIAAIAIEASQARRRVEESRQRFRSLFHYVPEGVFALDLDGLITSCNMAVTAITGHPREYFIGLPFEAVVPADERDRVRLHLDRAMTGEMQTFEHSGLRADGNIYSAICTVLPTVVDGARVGMFAISRDITEQRASRAALETALQDVRARNRELQEFAFIASHDLQEPLRKVQAFGDRLRIHLGETLDPEGADYIERMRSAASRMQQLIDDLLAYSRVATRGSQPVEVDLAQICQDVLGDLEMRIAQTGATIEVSPLPPLEADPTQMRQLLQNLLSNALKFRHPERSPHIVVGGETFEKSGTDGVRRWLRLRIADNGIGFDNRYRERILLPFQRLHGRSEYEGSGIGLAIVRRIVERHGGSILADGKPNEGATFTVELPLSPPAGPTAPVLMGDAL